MFFERCWNTTSAPSAKYSSSPHSWISISRWGVVRSFRIFASGIRTFRFSFLDSTASFRPRACNKKRLVRRMALGPQGSLTGSAPTLVSREAAFTICFTSSAVFACSIGSRPAASAAFASSIVSLTSMAVALSTATAHKAKVPTTMSRLFPVCPTSRLPCWMNAEYITVLPATTVPRSFLPIAAPPTRGRGPF